MTDPRSPLADQAGATALTPVPPGGPGAPAVVAFYLPQYHRIPENDVWWGEGFTDWRNVTAAKPLYTGHAIPNLPAELGAYDLRSRDVRSAQAELARSHGVYGFCYYFYWFGGRRLLERPLELMLEDGQPDLPFCLCWANEPWTRRWDGRDRDVLMPQHHERVGDLAILHDLLRYLEDPRYIRIDGRPLLLVYRQGLMPDAPGFAADLRAEAVRRGLPGLFLCNVLSIGDVDRPASGFDAAVEFPPHGTLGAEIPARGLGAAPSFRGHIYDYSSTVQTTAARPVSSPATFPGVMPRWDNTARMGMRAHVFHGSAPGLFERWLQRASMETRQRVPGAPLVFVNSWNEWAEGAHLEPDGRWGRRYLEAVARVVGTAGDTSADPVEDRATAEVHPTGLEGDAARGGRVESTALRPGWPQDVQGRTADDGSAWIQEADHEPCDSPVIHATSGQPLTLRGWWEADRQRWLARRCPGYLVLSSGDAVWHAPLVRRRPVADVTRGRLARGRRMQKLVRTVDRLPLGAGRSVWGLLARARGRVGFDVRFLLSGVRSGTYQISIVDADPRGARWIDTGSRVSVADADHKEEKDGPRSHHVDPAP